MHNMWHLQEAWERRKMHKLKHEWPVSECTYLYPWNMYVQSYYMYTCCCLKSHTGHLLMTCIVCCSSCDVKTGMLYVIIPISKFDFVNSLSIIICCIFSLNLLCERSEIKTHSIKYVIVLCFCFSPWIISCLAFWHFWLFW